MIGKVHANEARVPLRVRGPKRKTTEVEAIIDTGSSVWLTLPKPLVEWLGLPLIGPGFAQLGNETIVDFDVYEVSVWWNRRYWRIFADESPTAPLIGMSLLKDCELNIQVRHGGKVSIKPLPQPRSRR